MASQPRSVSHVLGTGALAGLFAGLAAGLIDALWSWGPAAQFVPSFLSRVRFVVYSGLVLGATGALVGFLAAAVLGHLSRRTRIGDLVRFGWGEHRARQANDPRDAIIGLSLVIPGVPLVALAIWGVYRVMTPIVVKSHALGLAVLSVIAATLVAIVAALVLMFVVGALVELVLRELAKQVPILAEPSAPLVAGGVLIAAILAWLAHAQWATAKILPLRGPVVSVLAALLAIPAYRPASTACDFIGMFRPAIRRTVWILWPVVLFILVLAAGGSAPVIKASTAYTGLGAPIARGIRKTFDRDRDGYSRFLGGGDCDDGDPAVHPGAPEIPDDGIDQNCVGGDASMKATHEDVAFAPLPPSVPKDMNILLVTIDTTRADHLGMYGYKRPTSPNMDALASQGTVFDAGWAHAPSTRYSMPAILTGRLPLDVFYDYSAPIWPGLSPAATTLGEYLEPLGFFTGAITNYWYFDPIRHMNQGFEYYDNSNEHLHGAVSGFGFERTQGSSSKEQTDKAITFVDQHSAQKWFLWVHYYDPHSGYEKHPEVPSFGSDDVALYDGEIRFTDLHLGRLIDDLKAKGLYDKTIIVITGDHGEGFGEHGVKTHGYHIYAPQTKVPFVIRVPGMPPRHAATPAGHIDIAPTLVNLAGGQPGPDMMGRSLVDVLAGADTKRTVFQQLSFENNNEKRAAVDEHCHVIYNVSPETSMEVYRVDRDPLEAHDLAGGDECAETRHAFERWYDAAQVPVGAAEALLPSGAGLPAPIDATIGGGARLLSVDASPARAKPGDVVTLTWTFEAKGRVSSDWKIFAHLKGPANAFVNGDHKPVRPFEWWKPGQFIRYTTTLPLPRTLPTGSYTLWVGLFRGNERARATSSTAKLDNNAVAAATIEIGP
ncbi:MAG TPA: sulfatase-like hydrolase/transferase [Kofleriaceae bacterium]|nr:sulfatase-like hydrolase/transferase [Kofleriaceae bacterium]